MIGTLWEVQCRWSRELPLESADELKAENFLDRREMGIINVGGAC